MKRSPTKRHAIARRTLLQLAAAGASAALAGRVLGAPSPDGEARTSPAATPGRPTPRWLGTARFADDDHRAVALDADGRPLSERRLPERAHGLAVHAGRGIGCVFARRSGNWLYAFDLADLGGARRVDAPPGRRFSGHGCYSRDGRRLYTTENDIERQRGVIGVHDVTRGYRRVGELDSHGVGPHEIVRPPDSELLVVANGGIATHPDHGEGRTPLNLGDMHPDIAVLDARDGTLLSRHVLPDEHHRVSLRHLAVDASHRVWFAAQFATDPELAAETPHIAAPEALPLAGSFALLSPRGHTRSGGGRFALDVLALPADRVPQRHAYLSSVASDGRDIVYTAARDGVAFRVDASRGELGEVVRLPDCSGVARDGTGSGSGFVVSSGLGEIVHWNRHGVAPLSLANCAWDNHLTSATDDVSAGQARPGGAGGHPHGDGEFAPVR